ncbi:MAG: hypothetical protein NTX79_00930 [Candidatus Micrarchaeota archaeon]|nr:hypothetical protein [Candidatus Micrarchaeota archaeon]
MNHFLNKNATAGKKLAVVRAFSAKVTKNLFVKPYRATKKFAVGFKIQVPFKGVFKEEKALVAQAKSSGLYESLDFHYAHKFIAWLEAAACGSVGALFGFTAPWLLAAVIPAPILKQFIPSGIGFTLGVMVIPPAVGFALGAAIDLTFLPSKMRKENQEFALAMRDEKVAIAQANCIEASPAAQPEYVQRTQLFSDAELGNLARFGATPAEHAEALNGFYNWRRPAKFGR